MLNLDDYGYPAGDSFLAVVDTETNGLAEGSDIIEIAIITLHPATLQTLSVFHSLVKPVNFHSAGRTDIHNISMDMLSNAPTFRELAFQIRNELEGKYMVAHNIDFDAMMLKSNFAACDVDADLGKGVCTYKLTGRKLSSAAYACRIPVSESHSALADAMVSASLLRLHYKLAIGMNVKPIVIPVIETQPAVSTLQRKTSALKNIKPATFRQKRLIAKGFTKLGNPVPDILLERISKTEASQLISGYSASPTTLGNNRYGGPLQPQKNKKATLMD